MPALSSIAGALGVSLSALFEGLEERPALVIVPKDERRRMQRDEDVPAYMYEALASTRPSRRMDPFVLTVRRSADRPPRSHGGEEFLYVLRGSIVLEYNRECHRLGEGDSAYFDGGNPHRLVNENEASAQVLVVYDGLAGEDGAARPGNGRDPAAE